MADIKWNTFYDYGINCISDIDQIKSIQEKNKYSVQLINNSKNKIQDVESNEVFSHINISSYPFLKLCPDKANIAVVHSLYPFYTELILNKLSKFDEVLAVPYIDIDLERYNENINYYYPNIYTNNINNSIIDYNELTFFIYDVYKSSLSFIDSWINNKKYKNSRIIYLNPYKKNILEEIKKMKKNIPAHKITIINSSDYSVINSCIINSDIIVITRENSLGWDPIAGKAAKLNKPIVANINSGLSEYFNNLNLIKSNLDEILENNSFMFSEIKENSFEDFITICQKRSNIVQKSFLEV